MKLFIGTLAFFVSTTAFATIFIQPNVFMASGPAQENYSANLRKITAQFKRVSQAEMGLLKFNGAAVEDNKVIYYFHRLESSNHEQTCWSNLTFSVTGSTPVVSDVKATLDCHKNQD